VRQSRTLGSVRGGDGADTVTPTRARSRKRWIHAKGKPTAATGPLLLGNTAPTFLRKKLEENPDILWTEGFLAIIDRTTIAGSQRSSPDL